MDKVVIEAKTENVIVKEVGKASGGRAGVVYVPKEWIGATVLIVKREIE